MKPCTILCDRPGFLECTIRVEQGKTNSYDDDDDGENKSVEKSMKDDNDSSLDM